MAAISLTQKLEGKKQKNKHQTKHLFGILKEKIYYVSCLVAVRHAPSIIRFVFQVHCVAQFSCSSLRLTSWLFLPEQHGPCTNYWKSFFLPMTSAYYHIHETLLN